MKILVENNHIYALTSFDEFQIVRPILVRMKSTWDKEHRRWKLSNKMFDTLIEELEDITCIDIKEEDRKEIDRLIIKSSSKIEKYRFPIGVEDFKVPPIKGKHPYEDFQLKDIRSLLSTNRFALYNDMGTGKSYVLITALDMYRKFKGLKKVVVLTSNSGTFNMKVEFSKFSDFTNVVIGDKTNRRPFDSDANVIICNYRSFLLISDEYEGTKSKNYRKNHIPIVEWLDGDEGALILDESHQIANPKSRQAKAVKRVASYFKYIYEASGTPADEEVKYYAQLEILDPALVKNQSFSGWCAEYFHPSKYSEFAPGEIKIDKKEELQSIVKSICVRRQGEEVLDLPPNYIQDYYVQFSDEHKAIYQLLVQEALQRIKEQDGILTSRAVIDKFQGLMLAIDNPHLIYRHEDKYSAKLIKLSAAFDFAEQHSKVEALLDLIEKHIHSKIVVWTSHPSVGNLLYGILKKYNPLVLNGETILPRPYKTLDQYKVYIKELFEKSDHQILIAGEQVLNTAITMIVPNVQIYFDTDFNYTNKNQSERRIYRIGQTQDVYTYNLVLAKSLDVVRAKNLKDKDFVNKKFLSQEYLSLEAAREMFTMEAE